MATLRQALTDCTALLMSMALLLALLRAKTSALRMTPRARPTTVQHTTTTMELLGSSAAIALLPCLVVQRSPLQSPIPWLAVSIIAVYTTLVRWSIGRDRILTGRSMTTTAFLRLRMERAVLRLRRLARDTRLRIPRNISIAAFSVRVWRPVCGWGSGGCISGYSLRDAGIVRFKC